MSERAVKDKIKRNEVPRNDVERRGSKKNFFNKIAERQYQQIMVETCCVMKPTNQLSEVTNNVKNVLM